MAEFPDNVAAGFAVHVEGKDVTADISDFIQTIEYESSDSIADVMKLTISNPDFVISKSKLFQPYNEVALWLGWGKKLTHIGRAIIVRPKIIFPEDGVPTLDIMGYSKDWVFSHKYPDPDEDEEESKAKGEKKKIETTFGDMTIGDAVKKVTSELGFIPDVDPIDADEVGNLDWPAGMTAAEYLRGLSNLTGFYMWVDADVSGKWTFHFKDPAQILQGQTKRYKFKYGCQELSTLLRFEPEMNFTEKFTKIRVQALGYYNSPTGAKWGTLDEDTFVVDDAPTAQDPLFTGDVKEKVRQFKSAEAVKLYVGDFSFVFQAAGNLNSMAKIKMWAKSWFARNRESFMTGNGNTIGIETLMSRQEHDIEGLGPPYDGKWYFSRVRHLFGTEAGYTCDFSARKVV